MTRSKAIKISIGVLISVLLVWLVYKHADWEKVGEALAGVKGRLIYLIPAIALFLFHYVIRALRWEFLLGKKTSFLARFNAIQFGNFATYMLPFRAGEFLRPLYLCKKEKDLRYTSTFVSIVTERFFDLIMALACLACMLYFMNNNALLSQKNDMDILMAGANALMILALVIFVFIIIAIFNDKLLFSIYNFCEKIFPLHIREKFHAKFFPILENLVEGVKSLKNIKNLIMTTILSALVWLSTIAFYYAFLFLFFDAPSLMLALAVVVCVAFAVAVPSAPGFIGVFQWGCILAFKLCGESENVGTAYSIISHMGHYLVFMIYGLVLLWVSGVKLGDKDKIEKELE